MSTSMTAKRFIELCRQWGVKWQPIHSGWSTRNRDDETGKPFGPVHGVMWHHTGSDSQTGIKDVLWNGRSDLPGPLCHAGIDNEGILWMAGWGRCNHAGAGDDDVLRHVVNEDYTGILKPNETNVDGNDCFYGFEIMYSGSHAMTSAQYRTAVRVSAMICTEHKWKALSVIGHGEWQPGKWDPGATKGHMIDMATVRNHIGQAIKEGPTPKVPPPSKPHPISNNYTVREGDTLWRIAASKLGDGNRWPEIVTANSFLIRMPPGTQITLPKK